jgi:NADPH-dependent 2,4-dienoyl-CoA reductase/sulfur reductase-like enzyme
MSERAFQFDIVIVGAGPAGIAAACAAAESGKRVAVVDDTPWLGGQIWRGQQARPSVSQAQQWLEKFHRSGATLLDRTSVIAAPENNLLLAEHPDGEREIRWEKLVLATGARELFLPFPGWTLPGVTGAGGLQTLAKHGWPVSGKKVVIAGTGPLLLAVADSLKKYGAHVFSIAEQAPFSRVAGFGLKLLAHPGKIFQGIGLKLRLAGVPYRCGIWPVKAEGADEVCSVTLTNGRETWMEKCDLLACGFGLVPNVELPLALGCELSGSFVRVGQWQDTSVKGVYCAGEPTGIGGAECALTEGRIAGYAAGGQDAKAEALFKPRASWHRFRAALAETFALRNELKSLAADDTLLCRCEDVALGRVKTFGGWRDAKLQTRCGMGACQGRVCGAAAKVIFGWGMESVRPPVLPARVGSLMTTDFDP